MKIINIIDNSSLLEFLNNINTPTLLRVYSNNCVYCIAMNEEWEKLQDLIKKNHKNDSLNIVDVEASFANKLPSNISSNILGYPTILALKNGEIVKIYEGLRKISELYEFCQKYLLKKDKNSKNSKKAKNSKKPKKNKKNQERKKTKKEKKVKK